MEVSIVLLIIILLPSVILHELGHGMVARWLGDDTAQRAGRLTLNPMPHIDPIGTILIPLILVLSQSPIIFGAAKPVPILPSNFDDPKKDMALVGLAGPAVNFLIAGCAAFLYQIIAVPLDIPELLAVFHSFVVINLFLGLFNLLPIPPLDGSRLLVGILPDVYAIYMVRLERYGLFILVLLLLAGIGSFVSGLVRIILQLLGMGS